LTFSEATPMIGNDGIVQQRFERESRTLDDCIAMSVCRWDGVTIGFVRCFRELIDARVFTNAGTGKTRWKGSQLKSLDFESRLNGLAGSDDARSVVVAERAQGSAHSSRGRRTSVLTG
jgi:hypothetical protein